jgi:hypothetical protein
MKRIKTSKRCPKEKRNVAQRFGGFLFFSVVGVFFFGVVAPVHFLTRQELGKERKGREGKRKEVDRDRDRPDRYYRDY